MGGLSLWHILILLVLLAVYAAPAVIAFKRQHPQRVPILLLDIFLGWTFAGWVGALIWSAWPLQADRGLS